MQRIKIVYWNDAHDTAGWIHEHEIDHSLAKVISVGFIVSQNESYISLAQSSDENGLYNNVITIPKVNITSIDDLYNYKG